MSGKRRRTERDVRRRSLGQNFLTDPAEIDRLIDAANISSGDLVLEVGPGQGALTAPLLTNGARVIAVERDPVWAGKLDKSLREERRDGRLEVIEGDFRDVPLPEEPYRVVACPPFGLTTSLLAHLLDDPERGPWRADLLIQRQVARKRAVTPPSTLRSGAWAPWWEFSLGPAVSRRAFRPVPDVDATVLVVERRDPPLLPVHLAPNMRDLLRPGWDGMNQSRS